MESPGKEYPRQLEDSLNARIARNRCPAISPRRVEVLNAAFAGMSLPTIEQDLRLRLFRLHPDVVVVYPAPVGYLEDPVPRAAHPDSTHAYRPFPVSRVFHLRLLDRARSQVKQTAPERLLTLVRRVQTERAVQSQRMGWQFSQIPPDRLQLFEGDLIRLVTTVRKLGAKPVLVTHANAFVGRPTVNETLLQAWEKFYPRAKGPIIIAFDSAASLATMRVATDYGLTLVDAAHRLSGEPSSDFGDFVHFTDSGAAAMADVLADSLCSEGHASGHN
jgi:hypothetical protein